MKPSKAKGHIVVFEETEQGVLDAKEGEIVLAEVSVEFHEKYFGLKVKFPDGSFRQLWISQNARIPRPQG